MILLLSTSAEESEYLDYIELGVSAGYGAWLGAGGVAGCAQILCGAG